MPHIPLKIAPNGIVRKVALMPVRDRKVIFARSKSQVELFYNLGGKPEPGESDTEALAREVKEEAGVDIVPGTEKLLHIFEGPTHGYVEGTVTQMLCYDAEYTGTLAPMSEIAELAWFTSADMQRTTLLGQTILRWFKDQNLID